MLRNPSLLVQPNSGFVPFSSSGTLAGDLDEAPASGAPAGAAAPAPTAIGLRHPVWEPGSAKATRRVEAAVLAAICGYFTFGLGKLLIGSF